ncbi:short-chain dehydrogenase/reductase family protein [Favolaschia claudopus]|uniref:Short-chain dehydrogenase/reductase family protein n=1 Tax=Favolaschia claudopus TaxID=2862362 RepID=A0AAW0AXB3_9AGAR
MASLLPWLFPPKFVPERDIPGLSGKIALVTGGNTGLGYQTVKHLLLHNATVYLLARSPTKAASALASLKQETGKDAVFIEMDLADLKSVRRAAEEFLGREERLDLMWNNAGLMACPTEMLTAQGYDLQFGTNVLGHFLLTELLLPALLCSHLTTAHPARIIHTSSIGHLFAPSTPSFESTPLKGGEARDAWIKKEGGGEMMSTWKLYGTSKLANILLSNHLARTHASDVLVSCAVHPGFVNTELGRHGGFLMQWSGKMLFLTPAQGALTQLWAGTAATPEEINGQYLVPFAARGKPSAQALDEKLEGEVVAYLRKQVEGF